MRTSYGVAVWSSGRNRRILAAGCHGLLAASACMLLLAGCAEEAPPPEPVVRPVRMLEVAVGGSGRVLEFPGKVSAALHADMAFEVSGKIVEFPVTEGQNVKKGAVLARLDPRDFQAARDAAMARLNAARADYERIRDLYERNAVSRQEYDVARRNFEVQEANIKSVHKALEDSSLRAPFAGRVAKKLVEDFANVNAKQPVLVLQDDSSLEVVFDVPESDWRFATPGLSVEERNTRLEVQVVLSAFPDKPLPGKLKELATQADAATRTFRATVAFDAPADLMILPGMTARVVLKPLEDIPKMATQMKIPANAVVPDGSGGSFVWKVDPDSMVVERRAVELGDLSGSDVGVKSGLSGGDLIATSGVHHLRDGMVVRRLEQ